MARVNHAASLIFTFALLVADAVSANESMHITIESGARHEFGGFGGSVKGNCNSGGARLLYGKDGCDARVIRVWAGFEHDGDAIANRDGGIINDITSYQPGLIVLLAPCAWQYDHVTDLGGYARHYADMMKRMRDRGVRISATGICNEPDDGDRLYPSQGAELIKNFRRELDSRGLDDVIIIAPENATVDDEMYEYVDNIKNDQEALDALDGWAFHSYNCSITYKLWDLTHEYGKTYWQTESSVDDQSTIEGGANSKQIGANCGVKILADLNMGTTHWVYFFATGGTSGTALLSGSSPMLQYWYMRTVAEVIKVGARFRYCLSDQYKPRPEMTWEYSQKPAIVAACAVNPDGTWGIGLCNGTGIQPDVGIAKFYPAVAYDVTVHVEELENAGEIEFDVWNNAQWAHFEHQATITMRDGEIGATLESSEMKCFKSTGPVTVMAKPDTHRDGAGNIAVFQESDAVRFGFPGRGEFGIRVTNMSGAIVCRSRGFGDEAAVSIGDLPSGVYSVRIQTPAVSRSRCIVVSR